eukprot:TRINITY_DN9714_c0_g2_i1.p1 TRINITY_DN9714_c0_g2~~TRINITY_DN9714_c0_g2_i1.p1  ORF type:complete len:156 (-),score=23.40 TRINITY_DN9714_c0_g2_i1:415-882(-)
MADPAVLWRCAASAQFLRAAVGEMENPDGKEPDLEDPDCERAKTLRRQTRQLVVIQAETHQLVVLQVKIPPDCECTKALRHGCHSSRGVRRTPPTVSAPKLSGSLDSWLSSKFPTVSAPKLSGRLTSWLPFKRRCPPTVSAPKLSGSLDSWLWCK